MKTCKYFCDTTLRYVLLLALIAALTYPAVNIFVIFPAFSRQLIRHTETEAIKVAKHLAASVVEQGALKKRQQFEANALAMSDAFQLEKLKIFAPSGEIIYSTADQDIGTVNRKPYFHQLVKKGQVFTLVVKKDQVSMEGRTVTRDVVETYVPIMQQGQFIGAFEIYYDITASLLAIKQLMTRQAIIVTLAAALLFVAFLFGIRKADQAIRQRDLAKEELRLHQENLEQIVLQRTEELSRAREEWENTFHAIGDIVTIHDADMRITRVNAEGCRILGASAEELVGRKCYEVFRGIDRPCQGCPEMQTLDDAVVHSAEIIHPNLGLTFLVSASPIFDNNRQFKGIVHIAKDITAQKQMAGQLRQAQKMEAIGTLAGGIAHDFNNILTGLIGYLELTLLGIDSRSQASADLQEVKKAAMRAADLVKQILTFSRQGEQELKPVRLTPIIKEALKLLRASLPATIAIEQSVADEAGIVKADPTQIHQLLMNLCTNGAHAMQEQGGKLTVQYGRVELDQPMAASLEIPPGSYIRLTVGDTGHGIAPEVLERIFDPYFTTKEQGKGTGFGLTVVHGIIAKHHGAITVESAPGKGATFRVYLPLVGQTASEEIMPAPKSAGGSERLLLVDDEETIVRMEKRFLESLGYRVDIFCDPRQALAAFREDPQGYDLLLTDMTMPHMTGTQLARKVLAMRPEFPVILCTGHSESVNGDNAHDLGFKAFLQKPVSTNLIDQAIRVIFDRERAGGSDTLAA